MSKRQETVADIIAEKRRRAEEFERDCAEKIKRGEMVSDCARKLVAYIRREADRLDAAYKRKLSDFNSKCDWSFQEALDFANTLANHGWTREANSDAASSCIYSLCRLLKELGNAAKLREAVKAVVDVGYPHNFQKEAPHIRGYCYDITRAIEKCFAALAAPPRNCDKVKTSWEVLKEWHEGLDTANDIVKLLDWLLAPATEKEGGDK